MSGQEKDFEALGRYVDASERVRKLADARHNLSNEISKILSRAVLTFSDDVVNHLDHRVLLEKSEELAQINVVLEDAIAEMDRYAAAAGKPALRRG